MLYISDLDGTLLNKNCELSVYSRTQLTQLLKTETQFSIATARGIYSIKEILKDLPLQLPVICNNGSYIRNFKTREALYQSAFQPDIVAKILKLTEEQNMEAFVTSFKPNKQGGGEDCLTHNLILNEGMQWFLNDRIRANDPRMKSYVHYANNLDHQITCLTIIDQLSAVTKLKELIDQQFSAHIQSNIMVNPYQRGFYWLTVQDINTTKGNAVKWLADYLNISLAEVTVFGDEVNDVSMFEVAGRKIAMDDAKEVLKQKADLIIGNHEEDAVVKFIKEEQTV